MTMEPNRVGRLLGIGARVAAGKLRDGTAGAVAAVERSKAAARTDAVNEPAGMASPGGAGQARTAAGGVGPGAAALADGSRRLARGAGRFGGALWKPFAHATGQLTLQITGLLFAFFALGFGAKSWQLYKDTRWGDHHLPMYAGFALLFLWFAVSSFWKAGRKRRG